MSVARTLKVNALKAMMDLSFAVPMLEGRVGHSIYPYMFSPRQLMILGSLAERASSRTVSGASFLEAGCAYGATTVFLNKLMDSFEKKHDYIAIDTFAGFVPADVEHEINALGKPAKFASYFVVNKKRWFDRTLALQSITRVRSLQADVSSCDFSEIAPIAFCLLDVDLYKPIKNALPRIYENMASGGVIVVDDCAKTGQFHGADLAYREFCTERSLPYTVVGGRLGVIEIS